MKMKMKMKMKKPKHRPQGMKMQIKRTEPARFTTDAIIHHTQTEFRITYFDTWTILQQPTENIAIKDVVAEVILTPRHAKALLKALEDNIAKYEKQYGEIKLPKQETPPKTEAAAHIITDAEAYEYEAYR